ncbi:uncharacterized protein LOC119741073 [Patiria miniata]|uniref:Uncharacterized protein n=1 Tax=Patiria miniata TaxID=46514 RepID=A0A914B9Z1_PATMI|nr:uncharacterized protein LOC119741073 [Patiria miniata]
MAEKPVENQPVAKPVISVTISGETTVRRLHGGADGAGGNFNKMLRRRRRSTDSPRELGLLREEKIAKQKLKEDLSRLASKVQKLKAVLAKRRTSSRGGDGGQNPVRYRWRDNKRGSNQAPDDWDEALDSASNFFLVSLAALLALWLAVNLFRGVAVYLLPELFLECAVLPPQTTAGVITSADISAVSDWRARTALAWQLLFGHHPCQPVYLHPQCAGQSQV